jgi:pimeloyl-ACP methyl ester carboxylesterase
MPESEPLPVVCPSCATPHPAEERFCRDCGLPLVDARLPRDHDLVVSDRHERARKIKPQLSEGPLVKVASASHQAEAELIQGLLLEEGVPSMVRRSAGIDVPDLLAAGRRDVLVPRSGVEVARDVLLQAEMLPGPGAAGSERPIVAPGRLLVGLLSALVLVALVAWIGTELLV